MALYIDPRTADTVIGIMRILQSSNIYLGRSFSGTAFHGEKLRTVIKSAFSRIIDLSREQSADLVILAGDTFANIDISQNLLNFFLQEIKRLEQTPVVIMPGVSDPYSKESFWEQWVVSSPAKNLYILTGGDRALVRVPELSAKIYGYPPSHVGILGSWPMAMDKDADCSRHLAIIYGDVSAAGAANDIDGSINYEKLASAPFDYIALGGRTSYASLIDSGVKAAYSGSPLALGRDWNDSGNVLVVELRDNSVTASRIPLNGVVWKEIEIPMESAANIDDLKTRLLEMSGDNVLLKVTLSGLALLEAGFNFGYLREQLESNFLDLEFADKTSVLPHNVSEIKVREKTILGQYLKVMVEKLNNSSGEAKKNLEESLKAGYSVLSGREFR